MTRQSRRQDARRAAKRASRSAAAQDPESIPAPDLETALREAVRLHGSGAFDEAERAYRQILLGHPDHPDVVHLLGYLCYQKGDAGNAVALIRRAIELAPDSVEAHNNLGLALQDSGRLKDAEASFRRAIALKPDIAELHNNFGTLLEALGRTEEAADSYRQALALRKDYAEALANLGGAYRVLGRLADAEACCREAIALDAALPEAHNNLGLALGALGRLDESAESLRNAVRLRHDYLEALKNLGRVLHRLGEFDEAVSCYRRAISLRAGDAEAHASLGDVLLGQGKAGQAAEACRKAVELRPRYAQAHNTLGYALFRQGEIDQAVTAYRKAIRINPGYADAHGNLGLVLCKRGEPEQAVAACRKGIELRPDSAQAHSNLAYVLRDQGRLEEAIAACHKALELDPAHAEAYNNMGHGLLGQCKMEEALAAYKKAFELKPDFALAHWNEALALLLLGAYEEGWEKHEWRWQDDEVWKSKRDFPQPLWDGSDPSGRTILAWGEQGVGDEIMFAGILPDLLKLGPTCIIECDPRLVPLFHRSFPGTEVVARSNPPDSRTGSADIAYQTPTGSLCRWLRAGAEAFPSRDAYLRADGEKVAKLRERYRDWSGGRPTVGMSWRSGNVSTGRQRSAALGQWVAVLKQSAVAFVNLQYGDCRADIVAAGREQGVEIYQDREVDPLRDLDAFAAQVAAMDLVISVDNSTVHMAGALGRPVWVLLPFLPDWRWLLEREDSSWYPTMRLFRQPNPGDWESVFARVATELSSFVHEHSAQGPRAAAPED